MKQKKYKKQTDKKNKNSHRKNRHICIADKCSKKAENWIYIYFRNSADPNFYILSKSFFCNRHFMKMKQIPKNKDNDVAIKYYNGDLVPLLSIKKVNKIAKIKNKLLIRLKARINKKEFEVKNTNNNKITIK